MKKLSRILIIAALSATSTASYAQFNESGIAAGFFDGSREKEINFSEFHLPPLAVLFENAKATPQVMSLQKAQEIAEAEVAAELFKPDRQFSMSALRQLLPQERLPDEFRDRDIRKRSIWKFRDLPVHPGEHVGPPVVQNLQPGHLLRQCRETSQPETVCLISAAGCILRAVLRVRTFTVTVSRAIQTQNFKKTIGQCAASVFQDGDAVVPDVENMRQAAIRCRIRYGLCVCIRVGHFLTDVFDGIGVFKEDPPQFHAGQGQVDLLKFAFLEKVSRVFHTDLCEALLSKLRDDVA